MDSRPPDRIATERLVLRRLRPEDAEALKEAIDSSLEHIRPWVPWSFDHPAPLENVRADLVKAEQEFDRGAAFRWAILGPGESEHLGGVGLYARVGAGALEVGYWLRRSAAGQGYATEAARAITAAGFALPGVDRLEMHVDAENGRSIAVPRRLGYRLEERRTEPYRGEMRELLVFELEREDWGGGGRT
jgi:RimJ/RimL family protein N-acetyltransferase